MPLIRSWCNAIEGAALTKLLNNEEVIGSKLVRKRAFRKWVSEETVVEFFTENFMDLEVLTPRKAVSPAQAEKLLRRDPLWDDLVELIIKPEGGITIAPITDPRPEVTRGSEFEDTTNE